MWNRYRFACTAFEWNQEIGCRQTLLRFQVPLKGLPEILHPPEVNEGQLRDCTPRIKQPSDAQPATEYITHHSDRCPVKKAEHRVVEFVRPDSDEIDVVGQACRKGVSRRRRRNFHQRQSCT